MFQIRFKPGGPALSLTAEAPIEIGTIPLRNVAHFYENGPSPSAPSLGPPSYSSMLAQEGATAANPADRKLRINRGR